jgi:hypothetical protein
MNGITNNYRILELYITLFYKKWVYILILESLNFIFFSWSNEK